MGGARQIAEAKEWGSYKPKDSGQGLIIQKEGISAKARQIARERLGLE
jgi:hypothetical protein